MKVLFVAARMPYPMDTGARIRAFNVLRAVAAEHEVTFLTMSGPKSPVGEEDLAAVNALGARVVLVENPLMDEPLPLGVALKSLAVDCPFNMLKYSNRALGEEIARQVAQGVDVIHCEHPHVAWHPLKVRGVGRVLDAHNVEGEIAGRLAQVAASPLKRLALKVHAAKTLAFERRIARSFDLVLAVSERDLGVFRAMSGRDNVRVAENGVDTDFFRPGLATAGSAGPQAGQAEPDRIVFVGSMDWLPNVDGARHFAAEILPLVRLKRPGAVLTIVGRDPTEAVLALGRADPSITVTGRVDDVRPYLEEAQVVVVPLRFGGGTRLKVLEAFSMAKPVVSTSLGAEGISCRDGVDVILRDDPGSFAQAVVDVLAAPGAHAGLGARARELAVDRYGWEAVAGKVRQAYRDLERGLGCREPCPEAA